MHKLLYNCLILFNGLLFFSCQKNVEPISTNYACAFPFVDSSQTHPNHAVYQTILEEERQANVVGAILLVKDKYGLWMGADGQADIENNELMTPCHRSFIGSISKVYTSAAVYSYIDEGKLSLETYVRDVLPEKLIKKVANADEAQIQHLLAHTSGIADFYSTEFELDRLNRYHNKWTKEDVLKYTYGLSSTHDLGETYSYSNTNFLILSMILEEVSEKSLETIYKERVFDPLQLSSAYYNEENIIPDHTPKGYADMYGTGSYIQVDFAHLDELGIGGDGGVCSNAYDLATFLEGLDDNTIISDSSYQLMMNSFDLPSDWHWETYGQIKNGYGIELFSSEYGEAIGHTGAVDGFYSYAFHFPAEDRTYVLLVNSGAKASDVSGFYKRVLPILFQ